MHKNFRIRAILCLAVAILAIFSGCVSSSGGASTGKLVVNARISGGGGILQDATVNVYEQGTQNVVATGTTNNEGKWEEIIAPGNYTIEISKEGYNSYSRDKTIKANGLVLFWPLSPNNAGS